MTVDSPAFGQADLSNCERELIHLAGSVQPYGAMLLLREAGLTVLQASANCGAVLGTAAMVLLEQPLSALSAATAVIRSASARTRFIDLTTGIRFLTRAIQ